MNLLFKAHSSNAFNAFKYCRNPFRHSADTRGRREKSSGLLYSNSLELNTLMKSTKEQNNKRFLQFQQIVFTFVTITSIRRLYHIVLEFVERKRIIFI